MKEATGELNATVIIVIAVGVMSAFFFGVIWPMLKTNFDTTSKCKKAICNCEPGIRNNNGGKCECRINGHTEKFYCSYKG